MAASLLVVRLNHVDLAEFVIWIEFLRVVLLHSSAVGGTVKTSTEKKAPKQKGGPREEMRLQPVSDKESRSNGETVSFPPVMPSVAFSDKIIITPLRV